MAFALGVSRGAAETSANAPAEGYFNRQNYWTNGGTLTQEALANSAYVDNTDYLANFKCRKLQCGARTASDPELPGAGTLPNVYNGPNDGVNVAQELSHIDSRFCERFKIMLF